MDLKALLGKKKELEPDMKDTKLRVLKDMRKVASDAMGDDLKGSMSKATVVGKTPEDLKKGLEKAKDVVGKMPMMDEASEPMEEEMSESPEEESEEYGDHDVDAILEKCDTPEEIDELMQKLAEKKRALES